MAMFDELCLWLDPVKRPGPEAMAVDEWLLETARAPVLRVYGWLGNWGSVGYFGKVAAATAAFPDIEWVRRWSGGGTVDHRADWTYTVVAPAKCGLARMRGAESYRELHAALAVALQAEGINARLSTGLDQTGAALCFENPVGHDLVDSCGRKLAGAGQRRTRMGLLHQGSVAVLCDTAASTQRAQHLAEFLSKRWQSVDFHPPREEIQLKVHARYGREAWTARC